MPPERTIQSYFSVIIIKKSRDDEDKDVEEREIEEKEVEEREVEEREVEEREVEERGVEERELEEKDGCGCHSCKHVFAEKPYQPSSKEFESENKGKKFKESWYANFPWLTVCTAKGKALCHTCMQVSSKGVLTLSRCPCKTLYSKSSDCQYNAFHPTATSPSNKTRGACEIDHVPDVSFATGISYQGTQ